MAVYACRINEAKLRERERERKNTRSRSIKVEDRERIAERGSDRH